MAITVERQATGANGLITKARITMSLTEYGDWLKEQAVLKLMQICEAVKVQAQRNVSRSTTGYGPSAEGEFPHADTGMLRNSIFWDVDRVKMIGIVGTTLKYGLWLEEGITGGAVITPIYATMLSWVNPQTGERVFARQVITKGQQPRSYLKRTVMEMTDKIKRMVAMPMANPPSGSVVLG